MLTLLFVSTATGLCTGLGSVPFWRLKALPRRLFDTILGFGAGLMLSAATLGLLSEALELVRPEGTLHVGAMAVALVGFAFGFVILFTVERFVPHQHAGGHHEHLKAGVHLEEGEHQHQLEQAAQAQIRQGALIGGALVFHRLPEGFAIGASFASGETVPLGLLVAFTVAIQNVCEGVVMAAPLRAGGVKPHRALLITSLTGLTVPITAVIGYLFAHWIAGAMPFALALAAGSLIGVVSNEIIPETHSHGNEGPATMGIVAGFILTIVIRIGLGID